MALVLAVLGIILAGDMLGRDLVGGAQTKQFYSGFVQPWLSTMNSYRDITGQFMGDGANNGGVAGSPNGAIDDLTNFFVGAAPVAQKNALGAAVQGLGIDICLNIKSDLTNDDSTTCGGAGGPNYNPYATTLRGSQLTATPSVNFRHVIINNIGHNALILQDVPGDVALGIDRIIDGSANGQAGRCVYACTTAGGCTIAAGAAPMGAGQLPTHSEPAGANNLTFAWQALPSQLTAVTIILER